MTEETKLKISNSTKSRIPYNKGKKDLIKHVYYTNGKINIRLPITKDPPKGFIKGRLRNKLSKESKNVLMKELLKQN